LIAVLDPSYPCHRERHVHFGAGEKQVDVPYPRKCPVCKTEYLVTRKIHRETARGDRIDALVFQPVKIKTKKKEE